MEITDKNKIENKFKQLQATEDLVFDFGKLKGKGYAKESIFLFGFNPFINSLENELMSLPKNNEIIVKIDVWIDINNFRIEKLNHKIKTIASRSRFEGISSIHLRYRKKLKVELYRIKEKIINEDTGKIVKANVESDSLPAQTKTEQIKEADKALSQPLPDSSKLLDFFNSKANYDYIMNLLVEGRYCQEGTFIWKDEGGGNKSLLAAMLKYFHKQGYYKNNKQLTSEQIKEVAQNTFGWELSIDTIKRAKVDNPSLTFIPIASTIS